ncbi:MAG: DHH family phosphoesterase [Clostridia bacterium]|nr:DHH family phosphoesterase [Clostridia bacterium]
MDTKQKAKVYYMTGGFYIIIIFLLGFITFWFNRYLAIAEVIIAALLCVVNYVYKKYTEKRISDMFETMTLQIGSETHNALMHFPLPTLLIEKDGKIKWYNELFLVMTNEQHLYDKNIHELIPGLVPETTATDPRVSVLTTVTYDNRTFRVFGSNSQLGDTKSDVIVLYFDEITEYEDLKQKYINEKTFECLVFVDNYDELMESAARNTTPQLQGQLYKYINDWSNENGGVLIKYEKDKYCILFEYSRLDDFIKNKFDILSKIRGISEGNTIPASVSIGIGLNGKDIVENDQFAKAAVNMALGRGGDQAVIKDQEQFRFYGGTSKEYEKSTRVKARVVSFALSGLITNADNIIVMSHKNADVDSLGAAFGVYRLCKMQDKPVNILLESYDQTVKNMLDRLENAEEYEGLFLNAQQAMAKCTEGTLFVVVDTHKPSLLEAPQLLQKAKQIVLIDHHRRGTEFIENTALIYHEPYASSTCEMLTEILQYSSDKMSLTKLEAECLYAGIVIDTKHFTFKTGVRTFEAASFLRKQGVDTIAIKTMFQQDLTTYIKRATIIRDAEIFRDHIAISVYREVEKNIQIVVAQAADELLNIKGITASFVLCKTENGVNISGRSLGGINVQVILEKLGGGGHMTIAGAQLNNLSLEEAKECLQQAIDDYYLETVD